MSIPSITQRLEEATAKAENASQIMHDVSNGGPSVEVPTESGPVPSLRKWYEDLNDRTSGAVGQVSTRVDKAVLSYPDYATAAAAAAELPDGQVVHCFAEQKAYRVASGGLVFLERLRSVRANTDSAVERPLEDKVFDFVSVKDFGAIGDGQPHPLSERFSTLAAAQAVYPHAVSLTDQIDWAAIQAAMGTASAIYLPKGVYCISKGLVTTSRVSLHGTKNSVINNINPDLAEPLIRLSGNATGYSEVSGFVIESVETSTGLAHGIEVDGGMGFVIENLVIKGVDIGVSIPSKTAGAYVSKCFVQDTRSHGISIDAGNLTVSECYVVRPGKNGFYFTSESSQSAGIYLMNCTAFLSTSTNSNEANGFVFQGNQTYSIIDVIASDCVSSTMPWGHGFLFDTYGHDIKLSNCFSELAGVYYNATPNQNALMDGFHFTNQNKSITVSACSATFSSANGLYMDGSQFSITGGYYALNNTSLADLHAGLVVGKSADVTDFVINGVNTSPPSLNPVHNKQDYGIYVRNTATLGVISSCTLVGKTKPLSISSTSDVLVSDCPGYKNVSFGVAAVESGTNRVTVTHRLSSAPKTVSLTPRNTNLATSNLRYWVGTNPATDAQSFTIELSAAATSNCSFCWRAEL